MELKHFDFKFGKQEIKIPYYEIVGKKPGRFGFIAGGVRGDDINSLNILRNFVRVAKLTELEKKITGVLIIFPALNLPAVASSSRFAHQDGLDLFKQFGKSPKTLTQTLAYELTHNFFKKCDFGIIFTDSRTEFDLLPHSKVYFKDESLISNLEELKSFGVKLHFKTQSKKNLMPVYLSTDFGTSMSVFEIGSKTGVETDFVKPAMSGIRSIMSSHGLLPNTRKPKPKQTLITSKSYEKSKNNGLLSMKVELGQAINIGDKLGVIYDPVLQKEFPIIATKSGSVYSVRNSNLIQEGQALYYILPNKSKSRLVQNKGFKVI